MLCWKAQKISERWLVLKGQFEQSMKEAVDKYQGVNLYLKNLDDIIGDEKLKELFSEFGTITSCKVCKYDSFFCWYLQWLNHVFLVEKKMCYLFTNSLGHVLPNWNQ